jgi:hypothetical protein
MPGGAAPETASSAAVKGQAFQRLLKLCWQLRPELCIFSVAGKLKAEQEGVEELPFEVRQPYPVDWVSSYRATNSGEMDSDLVGASCVKCGFDQAVALKVSHYSVRGACLSPLGNYCHPLAIFGMAPNRGFDNTFFWGRTPLYQHRVPFQHGALF